MEHMEDNITADICVYQKAQVILHIHTVSTDSSLAAWKRAVDH